MTSTHSFTAYAKRLKDFIQRASTLPANASSNTKLRALLGEEFETLALGLFQLQFHQNAAYRQWCESKSASPHTVKIWKDIPAIPTSAFKELELTSLSPNERATVFHSSGTTEQRPSRHFHNAESLALYEASLLPWFQHHVLPNIGSRPLANFICLTPPPSQAPHSSLAHMFGKVHRSACCEFTFMGVVDKDGAWEVDYEKALAGLEQSVSAVHPVVLLGSAFNFVHLLDWMNARAVRMKLPPGSCAMETGGYKGRSRALSKPELHSAIQDAFGLPESHIVCEYGMSELSSQAYDRVVGEVQGSRFNAQRCFHFPPWARIQILSPETGGEVADGETGLLRACDLANVRSVMAIQTEDLAVRRGDGFELLGRAATAEARGCSLMAR
jgi:hypothetical protein